MYDSDESKATSGYVFMLGGGAVAWKLVNKLLYHDLLLKLN